MEITSEKTLCGLFWVFFKGQMDGGSSTASKSGTGKKGSHFNSHVNINSERLNSRQFAQR